MSTPGTAVLGEESRAFMQAWAESFTHVLGQISGGTFAIECTDAAPPDAVPPHESDLQALISCASALRGEFDLRLPRAVALALAQQLLSEPQNPDAEFTQESRDGVEELLRQVSGHAATSLKVRWGEVDLKVEIGNAPGWQPAATGWMSSAEGTAFRVWMEWQLSTALIGSLRMAQAKAQVLANAQAQLQAQPPSTEPAEPVAATPPAKLVPDNAEHLMDVGLAVTLRFGGRRMLLGEVLELNSGSVVELDRQVHDPADLLLEGRVIARGEVVVVDGNYGLRVTEVVPPPLGAERKAG